MKKIKFSRELAYFIGIILLAIGTAMMSKGGYGMSMVVAPAYIIYQKFSAYTNLISFGLTEYIVQGILLIIMIIVVGRFKFTFIGAFITTFIYGLILDLFMYLMSLFSINYIVIRIIFYIIGELICTMGIAFLFQTYLIPEVYDLFVKEVSKKYNFNFSKTKIVYDIISLLISISLSFILFGFGNFVGVGIGTIIIAFINGPLIGLFTKLYLKIFEFDVSIHKLKRWVKEKDDNAKEKENIDNQKNDIL